MQREQLLQPVHRAARLALAYRTVSQARHHLASSPAFLISSCNLHVEKSFRRFKRFIATRANARLTLSVSERRFCVQSCTSAVLLYMLPIQGIVRSFWVEVNRVRARPCATFLALHLLSSQNHGWLSSWDSGYAKGTTFWRTAQIIAPEPPSSACRWAKRVNRLAIHTPRRL